VSKHAKRTAQDEAQQIARARGGRVLSKDLVNRQSSGLWECAKGHRWQTLLSRVKAGKWCPTCAGKGPVTIQDMQRLAAERGGQCLSTKYVNTVTKLRWRCAEGHQWLAKPNNVHRTWCPECAHHNKLSLAEFRALARKRGGKLLSRAYVNNHTSLLFQCGAGHTWRAQPNYIKGGPYKRGTWCPKCSRRGQTRKPVTIEDLRQVAAERGGKCLSKRYAGLKVKLEWQCGQGHKWMARPVYVKQGTWCPVCSGRMKLTIEQLREAAAQRGGKCLAAEYVNTHTPVLRECAEGHRWEAQPADIRSGIWCPMCARKHPLTIEEMRELARSRGGRCLSKTYVNNSTPLLWRCAKGHVWRAEPKMVKPTRYGKGTWCPYCARTNSVRSS